MNKEEILRKSRESMMDEGKLNSEQKSQSFGIMIASILFSIIVIINVVMNRHCSEIFVLYSGYLVAYFYQKYKFSQSKSHKIIMIFCSFVLVLGFVFYMTELL